MNERIKSYETKMTKTLESLDREYNGIRAGRANPHILDRLVVDYYGSPTPIQQVGNITVPEARIIMIQPWESKMIKEIEKAIMQSDIGINPSNDGKAIRLVFPELTEERRKELAKDVKKKGEAAKKAEKAKEISEDETADIEKEVQKLTDKYVAEVDKAIEAKTKEIMTV